ncbi:MAG: hypothetical protein U0T82_08985 [Bacteroidales bacterium]
MKENYLQFGRRAVILNMAGILLSGLLFPVLTQLICPQPSYTSLVQFAEAFHPLQTATFFSGFLLITGSLFTFVSLYFLAGSGRKARALSALVVNLIFSGMVFLNYVLQISYVPYLAHYQPVEADILLPMLTMSNPGSLAWALEMYGWGGIGFSYLLAIPLLEPGGTGKVIRILFALNGGISILGALLTSLDMHWIFSPAGFASLILWNMLVLVIDGFLLRYFSSPEIRKVTEFLQLD